MVAVEEVVEYWSWASRTLWILGWGSSGRWLETIKVSFWKGGQAARSWAEAVRSHSQLRAKSDWMMRALAKGKTVVEMREYVPTEPQISQAYVAQGERRLEKPPQEGQAAEADPGDRSAQAAQGRARR